MNFLKIVYGDGGEALYVNDLLAYEGYEVMISDISEYCPIQEIKAYILNRFGLKWIHGENSFPLSFIEIPSEYYFLEEG